MPAVDTHQLDAAATPDPTPVDPRLLDVDELERVQHELDSIQSALDALDRIPPTTSAEDDPAAEILALIDGLPAAADESSDLVGDGDVVAVEEVEPGPEVVLAAPVVLDPPASEVGDAVALGAEELLDVHDDAAVGEADDLAAGEALGQGVEGPEHSF